MIPTPKSKQETADDTAERQEKFSSDWWLVRLTGALVFVGIVQGIVFAVQAKRLKDTINKMDEVAKKQANDMAASIAEASRAATAMEGVALAMEVNSQTAIEMAAVQRDFGQRQMRAYLSVNFASVFPQDDALGSRTEVRFILINTGNTPAHEVCYRAQADVLPFPLPDHFDFPIEALPQVSVVVISGKQQLILNTSVRNLLSTQQINNYMSSTGNVRLYAWGIITYKDAFDNERQTKFCMSMLWLNDGNIFAVSTNRHNNAT